MLAGEVINILAVGDISFSGTEWDKPSQDIFSSVKNTFREADLVVGNLENPLVKDGHPVPGKCTLRGSPGWSGVMQEFNIGLVSLANNHIMDYGPEGLFSTMDALNEAGIDFVGAGRNRAEALSPRYVTLNGVRVAFLARSSVIVSSPSYARDDSPGVAFLDNDETVRSIKKCRDESDLVVVLIHWGLEEYLYPSPEQIELAKVMVNAGAGIILGHHPHVVQGVQRINDSVIAYSLGNIVFNDLAWDWDDGKSGTRCMTLKLSEENRKGLILRISHDSNNRILVSKTFTKIGADGSVGLDRSPDREIEFFRLSKRIDQGTYRWWWKFYALHREWMLRICPKLDIRKISVKFWMIRPRHFRELIKTVKKSGDIASGKTTNPYE